MTASRSESETRVWKRTMFPALDTPIVGEYAALYNGTVLEQAICELWRGRSIVSSVTAARLSRELADALLVALGEMPADHAEQVAALSPFPPTPEQESDSD